MKKADILEIVDICKSGTKMRIEFNIGSSGTQGAVEGFLEKDDKGAYLVYAVGQPVIDLSFKPKEVNGYTWEFPEDIVDIHHITLL